VDDCRSIVVHMEGARANANLVRKDETNDLALLRVDVRQAPAFARFRGGSTIRPGDDVVVAGFPLPQVLQNGLNITTGNVSAMAGLGGNTALMQITAPVQPGNSGGPLLDMAGNVVGVIVSKLDAQRIARATGDIPQNVNFAVQGAVARLFVEAGGQRIGEAPSAREMRAADVGEQSRNFTFQIECR
jgi:S1-C subfamily serine protease